MSIRKELRGSGVTEMNFIGEFVRELKFAQFLLETRALFYNSEDRLNALFDEYPELEELTHWQIGQLMGLTRETVSRYLGKKKAGLLDRDFVNAGR